MDKQIDKLINHIRNLENRLGEVDNNPRYIKMVQALKHSLDKWISSDRFKSLWSTEYTDYLYRQSEWITDTIRTIFPQSSTQICVVHLRSGTPVNMLFVRIRKSLRWI